MKFIDLGGFEADRNFWILAVGFMYAAGIIQLAMDELMLGTSTLGMAIIFSAIAHRRLKEE